MTLLNPGRLAIHRRSDEIAFLQHLLRVLSDAQADHGGSEIQDDVLESVVGDRHVEQSVPADEHDLQLEILVRERDLADELLHTRQTEPLGETLQRRLAMAELICRDLVPRAAPLSQNLTGPGSKVHGKWGDGPERVNRQDGLPDAYCVAQAERRALNEMLNQWWAWLRKS